MSISSSVLAFLLLFFRRPKEHLLKIIVSNFQIFKTILLQYWTYSLDSIVGQINIAAMVFLFQIININQALNMKDLVRKKYSQYSPK